MTIKENRLIFLTLKESVAARKKKRLEKLVPKPGTSPQVAKTTVVAPRTGLSDTSKAVIDQSQLRINPRAADEQQKFQVEARKESLRTIPGTVQRHIDGTLVD